MAEKPSESDFECGNLEYGAHASQSSTDSSDPSVDDEPSKEELDSEPEDSSDEGAEADRRSHTLVFKCIGATKSKDYQAVLKKARDLIASGQSVPVRLSKEPQNPYNSRAIAFTCYVDGRWKRIGYVVDEIVDEVHTAIDRNEIISVVFSWVRYITEWSRSGPGFFAGIAICKAGPWPHNVVTASSTK